VDALLRGKPPNAELRYRDSGGNIHKGEVEAVREQVRVKTELREAVPSFKVPPREHEEIVLFPFGVARNRLREAASHLRVPLRIVDALDDAHAMVTTKHYYRRRPKVIVEAESAEIPIYVLRANTAAQMESFLKDLFRLGEEEDAAFSRAMQETEEAIRRMLDAKGAIDLSPQNAYIRKHQHQMAEAARLDSKSYGKEPYRHVRIINRGERA
jgi:hypothetical protein